MTISAASSRGLYSLPFYALVALTLYLIYRLIDRIIFTFQIRKRYDDLPHLPRHWLWGNLVNGGARLDPRLNRHPDYGFEEIWEECGRPPWYLLDMAPIDRAHLLIAHPEPAEAIVQPSTEYKYSAPKSDTYKHNNPLIGSESIITAGGEDWKSLRRRFNPGFQPKYLLSLAPIIVGKTRIFIDRLKAAAASGETITLHRYAQDLTTDIISQLAAGKDLRAQSTPEGAGEKGRFGVLRSSRRLSELVYASGRGFRPLDFIDLIRPTKAWWYERIYDSKVEEWVSSQVQEMQLNSSQTKSETERSISQLAMAGLPPSKSLTRNTIHQIKSFFFAGQDTTSILVQWMAYEMYKASRDPLRVRIIKRLREEHNIVFGDSSPWNALDLLAEPGAADSLLNTKLPYTTAFVKETLRLHPPAGTARLLPKSPPYIVHVDGKPHDISGMRIYICQWLVHRNPAVWGSDALVFNPDRWLDEKYISNLPPGAWRPFERGPRNCIGQELAMTEGKVVLCAVARGLEWEKIGLTGNPGPDGDVEREVWSKWAVTSVPVDGMKMKVRLVGQ